MLKIGLFTFGGGYAMIALLEDEFVSKKKWLMKDEFLDIAAIAESTPGPIAINAATYVGYKNAGVPGSVVATLGVCIPSFVIIYIISLFFDAFLTLKVVGFAFRGIQVCVVYLILSAGIKMLRGMKKRAMSIVLFSVVLVLMVTLSLLSVKFSTIVYILASGCVGVVVYLLGRVREGRGK
jgi:chromate transporter